MRGALLNNRELILLPQEQLYTQVLLFRHLIHTRYQEQEYKYTKVLLHCFSVLGGGGEHLHCNGDYNEEWIYSMIILPR